MKKASSDIETLNVLFLKYCKAQKVLADAYAQQFAEMDEKFCSKKRACDIAASKFESFRRKMSLAGSETKFDRIAGVYFLAQKMGKKVFHKVVEVPADSEDDALLIGRQAALAMSPDDKDVKFEVSACNVGG